MMASIPAKNVHIQGVVIAPVIYINSDIDFVQVNID